MLLDFISHFVDFIKGKIRNTDSKCWVDNTEETFLSFPGSWCLFSSKTSLENFLMLTVSNENSSVVISFSPLSCLHLANASTTIILVLPAFLKYDEAFLVGSSLAQLCLLPDLFQTWLSYWSKQAKADGTYWPGMEI